MKLRNLIRLGAFKNIQLIQTFFLSSFYIEKSIIGFDNTGSNLDKGIFADERISDCFPYICRFRFGKIIICLKNLICLLGNSIAGAFIRAWKYPQISSRRLDTPQITGAPRTYRNNASVLYVVARAAETSVTENSSPSK